MDHIPLSVVRISADEQEMIFYFRLLPPSIQGSIAYMIAGNLPAKPIEQDGLTYADRPRLVSSK